MNVLIVEDDNVLSLFLTKMIEHIGHNVIGVCTTGKNAIQKIESDAPDLVLMDIMLEDEIDGIQVVEKFEANSTKPHVIYITGNSDEYNKTRAKQTTYIDYLIKPVGIEDLTRSIDKI